MKLYLLTEGFPYGKGEKSFILPELPYLCQTFDVTIIPSVRDEALIEEDVADILGNNMKCIPYVMPKETFVKMIFCGINALFKKTVWKELYEIFKRKKNLWKRVYSIISFYIHAEWFKNWLNNSEEIEKNGDVIFYSYWAYIELLSANLLKDRYPKITVISRIHGFDLYMERNIARWQPFKKYMDEHTDCFFFIAQNGLGYYKEHYSIPANEYKYHLCRLGTREAHKRLQYEKQEEFHMVSCSSIIALKRIELIIYGLAKIENKKIIWTHFGSGEKESEIKELAHKYLPDNIRYRFMGYVENEQIVNYYSTNSIDCFITTSESEGCPVSIMEALSLGIPIIGTAVGEIPLMIENNGILLRENPSEDEVSRAIWRMMELKDDGQIEVMRRNSYEIWERDYNVENNIERFIEVLKREIH